MYLKRLEISGFKSFAQKTILDFSGGITAIVGPNGCGKSNIVDAIKWVMGEQSMKSVRGKKGEDLIFSGSDKKVRLSKARVSLFMDNSGGTAPIDFAEVVISRNIFRAGENEYHINNSKVRLKDVADILVKARMAQKSFSIINQGMADAILNYSPMERQLILEEAAGVREYQVKKEEAVRKIKNSKDNLGKVVSLMAEIAPHLGYLKNQARKAEKREEVAEELRNIQKIYFGAISKNLYKDKNQLSRKNKSIRDEIFRKSQELINLKKDLNKEEKNMFSGNTGVFGLQQKWNDLRIKIGEMERVAAKIEAKMEFISAAREPQILPVDIDYIKTRISQSLELLKRALDLQEVDEKNKILSEGLKMLDCLHSEIENGKIKKYLKEPEINPNLLEEKKELESRIAKLSLESREIQTNIAETQSQELKEKAKFFEMERRVKAIEDEIGKNKDALRDLDIEEAKISMRLGDIEKEIADSGMDIQEIIKADIKIPELFNQDDSEREIRRLKVRLDEIGSIDQATIREFHETDQRYQFLEKESGDLTGSIFSLKNVINELEEKIRKSFNEYFSVINNEFNNYFRLIFGGGRASLLRKTIANQISDGDNAIGDNNAENDNANREGVDISAMLPGKKIKDLSLFSGGERSLTAVALLFAIIASASPPFLVLDEIDAALDEDNSQKFGKILQELSKKTQFILITHNRETMKLADILYGVTMDEGVSRVLSLKLV
ncbi:MAG: AAA family ATPase, partial [Patescibacteria group bacterium]